MSFNGRALRLAALFALLFAAPVQARDAAATLTVRLFDTIDAFYAPPPWVSAETADAVEIFQDQGVSQSGTRLFIKEYIPKGESFDDWSELYAIHAETPLDDDVEGYRNGLLGQYGAACGQVFWQGSDPTPPGAEMFIVYCTHYVDRPEVGEVAMFHMRREGRVVVKNYYHRRVPAYDNPEDLQLRGISPSDFIAVMDDLRRLRLE